MMQERPIQVLLVDDDEDDHLMFCDLLSGAKGQKYQVEWAPSFDAGRAALARGGHDVWFLDYRLGHLDSSCSLAV